MTHDEIEKLLDEVERLKKDLKRQGKRQGADGQCPMCDSWVSKKSRWQTNAVIPAQELAELEQKIADLEKENEVLREQNLMAVEEINSLELKIKKLESRNAKLIDEANKSMLHAHDYMNKLLNLEAVRKAAQNYVDTFACRLTLTSSITVPERLNEKFRGGVKVKKLSETDFDGLGELKQALNQLELTAHNKGE